MAPRTLKIPNKRDAINKVAMHLIGHVNASEYAEILGVSPQDINRLTPAEMERLTDAVEIVQERLRRMVND